MSDWCSVKTGPCSVSTNYQIPALYGDRCCKFNNLFVFFSCCIFARNPPTSCVQKIVQSLANSRLLSPRTGFEPITFALSTYVLKPISRGSFVIWVHTLTPFNKPQMFLPVISVFTSFWKVLCWLDFCYSGFECYCMVLKWFTKTSCVYRIYWLKIAFNSAL